MSYPVDGALFVALLVSAWIEMQKRVTLTGAVWVALLVSAWIEIFIVMTDGGSRVRRTPRECVD